MAKRELSSTLKNLKFMQRAAPKDEKTKKEEEVMPAADFPSSGSVKRCVVIVEGDPLPRATRGRISFLGFNPSIENLNEKVSDHNESESAATSSGRENKSIGENESSRCMLDSSEVDASNNDANANSNLKRKQAEAATEPQYRNKTRKNDQDNLDSSPARDRNPQKPQKREKLNWNVLRPPKHQNKKS